MILPLKVNYHPTQKNSNLLASQLFIAKTSPEMEFWKSTLIIKPLGNTMMIDCI